MKKTFFLNGILNSFTDKFSVEYCNTTKHTHTHFYTYTYTHTHTQFCCKYILIINFILAAHSQSLIQNVGVIINGIFKEIKSVTPIPCSQKRPCPIYSGTDASFQANFEIPWFPAVSSIYLLFFYSKFFD